MTLLHTIIGAPQREPEWERHSEGARWTNALRHATQQSDTHGGDSFGLERSGEQSHGLRAHRSHRDQEHRVDVVRVKDLGNARASLPDEPARRRDRAVDADVPRRDCTDCAVAHELV